MASSNPLAAAADALSRAEKKFPSSMAKKVGVDAKAPPKNTVDKASKPPAPKAAGDAPFPVPNPADAGALKAHANAMHELLPKFHEGGKIKKDGVQKIDAEKGETVLPNDAKKATELAMDHISGLKAGLEHGKKHEGHKSEHKHPAKRHGKVHHVGVKKVDDGSFVMTNQHHPMEDGSSVADTTHTSPDMDGVLDHMQEHMGEPNPGEAEAEAGPAAPAAGGAPVAA